MRRIANENPLSETDRPLSLGRYATWDLAARLCSVPWNSWGRFVASLVLLVRELSSPLNMQFILVWRLDSYDVCCFSFPFPLLLTTFKEFSQGSATIVWLVSAEELELNCSRFMLKYLFSSPRTPLRLRFDIQRSSNSRKASQGSASIKQNLPTVVSAMLCFSSPCSMLKDQSEATDLDTIFTSPVCWRIFACRVERKRFNLQRNAVHSILRLENQTSLLNLSIVQRFYVPRRTSQNEQLEQCVTLLNIRGCCSMIFA